MKRSWLGFVVLMMMTSMALAGCGRHHGYGHSYGHDGDTHGVERGEAQMSSVVDRTIKDPDKASQVKAIVGEIIAEVKGSYEQNRAYHEKLYALNVQYDAAPEDFTKILDELNAARMRSAVKILGFRFKMKGLLTQEEWKALTDEMDKVRGSYRHKKKADGAGKDAS